MPTFHFTAETMPTPEEFRRMLREASENYDPLEELLALEREFVDLERKHGLSSAEFYARFLRGEAGDSPEMVTWAGLFEIHMGLKRAISDCVNTVAVE
jgi:hypothetical protein